MLSDPLPTGTVYNFATDNGSTLPCAALGDLNGGATVSCQLASIAKGGQATVVVSVTAPQSATTYGNTATVTTTSTDPSLTNNSVTVTVQTKASTGGGVNKGGINDPTTTLTQAPCAVLANLSAPVGYYLTWAAIWNTFSLKSCSANVQTVNVEVTETNQATGLVDYDIVYPLSVLSGQNLQMVLDNDYAPFSTTYTIGFTATDSTSGNLLATGSVVATTPPPQ